MLNNFPSRLGAYHFINRVGLQPLRSSQNLFPTPLSLLRCPALPGLPQLYLLSESRFTDQSERVLSECIVF